MKLLDGRIVAKEIDQALLKEIEALKEEKITPGLAVMIVGDDGSARSYIRMIERKSEKLGINFMLVELPGDVEESLFLDEIKKLNDDHEMDGILIQMPLPGHIDHDKVVETLSYEKDVDGFKPEHAGNLFLGKDSYLPCTPAGIMEILKYEDIDITGMNAVVIGRSSVVGKPIAMLLLEKNATVTICHSRSKDLSEITRKADLIVVAVGRCKFLKADMVKDGAIVIDVGIHAVEGKILGDVDFEEVKEVAGSLTPVPGGVGSTTISMLMSNVIKSTKKYRLRK